VRLREQGWFERARPLPKLPAMVGLVTSRSGAALQDFLRTRSQRWPLYPVRLAHSTVQGPGAAQEIAGAVDNLVASGVDLVVLARGGGSLEDLWAFNELPVAEAIWRCKVPVVSAVGHESDFTLADMVADQRAHTPTDGAQLVIPERALLLENLDRLGGQLEDGLGQQVAERRRRLEQLQGARVLVSADWMIRERGDQLSAGGQRLALAARATLMGQGEHLGRLRAGLASRGPALQLARRGARLAACEPRLGAAARRSLERRCGPLATIERTLQATSPFAVLARGYSVTRVLHDGGTGEPLTSAAGVSPGARLETVLHSGRLVSRAEEVLADGPTDDAGSAADGDGGSEL
ncbi:MAG: exodeoxyribonuclease VII large subunit, partial [Planctomycetota bacterium]|nr:exodeoxyribonuclease VII large subunit [Planctomycetota bacterium]